LLYPDAADEAHIVLTERPAGELRHSGEVSLPGGAMETTDASAVAAALREAREEVGLDTETAGVEVLGMLSPLEISVSGFRLTPVLAVALRRPTFRPDPREVATLLEARIESFLSGAPIEQVEEERQGRPIRYGAYLVGGYRVWGATAAILGQLGAIIGPFTKAATAD
ncbi:MAG: CoA pyrophosphatase, partial [Chloroflexi bacterium]|nr:CoA pyrophosphatase [Chloroflexota bacterium]